MFFVSFTDATFFSTFLIFLISINKQVLLKNLCFLDLYMCSFEMIRMWFWIKTRIFRIIIMSSNFSTEAKSLKKNVE